MIIAYHILMKFWNNTEYSVVKSDYSVSNPASLQPHVVFAMSFATL